MASTVTKSKALPVVPAGPVCECEYFMEQPNGRCDCDHTAEQHDDGRACLAPAGHD
jgi:hypothetical protein